MTDRRSGTGLISAFAYSIGIRGIGAILALSLNVLLARLLGVAEYGRYMALLSMALVLGALAVRGSDYVLTRELAGDARPFDDLRKRLYRWASFRVGKSALLAVLVFLAWSVWIYFGWAVVKTSGQAGFAVFAGIAIILFVPFVAIVAGAINGYAASLKSQALTLVVQNGAVLGLLGILYLAIRVIDIAQVLWLQATGYAASLLIGVYWLSRLGSGRRGSGSDVGLIAHGSEAGTKSWTVASRHFLLVTVAALLINKLDVVVVSAVSSSQTTGFYVAGARLAQVALMIALAMNVVLSPRIARTHKAGDEGGVKRLVQSGLKVTVPVAVIEVVLACFFSSDVVTVFGAAYANSSGPFLWVMVAYAFWTALAPAYAYFSMAGKEKFVATVSWLTLIVNLGGVLLLTPFYGADGAGAAMALGYGISAVTTCVVLFVQMKVNFRSQKVSRSALKGK